MQPYFFPYLGYFQLIRAVDLFVVYDDIKYTKKGWINRNRLLRNGNAAVFSLPLKSDSDLLDIRDREVSATFDADRLLNQITGAYATAPYFAATVPVIRTVLHQPERNLFRFLHTSLVQTCLHLGIKTEIVISSSISVEQGLRHQERVLAVCKAVGATTYVNAIGGTELYARNDFLVRGVDLKFLRSRPFTYRQFDNDFVPSLSIIDVLMFNPLDAICSGVQSNYDLI